MSLQKINKSLIDCNKMLFQIKSRLISDANEPSVLRNEYVIEYLKDTTQQILIAKNSLEELYEQLKIADNNFSELCEEIKTERKLDNKFIKSFLPLMLIHNMSSMGAMEQ